MKWLRSFGFAFKGFWLAMREELNLRIQVGVALLVVVLGFYFGISSTEWIILLMLIGLVISAELFNTALEKATDLITREHHPLAGQAKDIAASAVLVLSVVSTIVGFIIFARYV